MSEQEISTCANELSATRWQYAILVPRRVVRSRLCRECRRTVNGPSPFPASWRLCVYNVTVTCGSALQVTRGRALKFVTINTSVST